MEKSEELAEYGYTHQCEYLNKGVIYEIILPIFIISQRSNKCCLLVHCDCYFIISYKEATVEMLLAGQL